MRTEELFAFMYQRHDVYVKKAAGFPKPWTQDVILQNYRFCNVYRELDKETQWFAASWREPHKDDPDLWFASLVFRFINRSDTATALGYPVPWDARRFKTILQARKKKGLTVYSGAYMISTHGVKEEKATYLAKSLTKIWKQRGMIRPLMHDRLSDFHARLMDCFDVGSFIAAQVIADIKYEAPLWSSGDWHTFAASGPGSKRGMSRVMGLATFYPWNENEWRQCMMKLKSAIDPMIDRAGMPTLHAQDLQNCLCEFDKYERARTGEGRPKQRYKGAK